MRDNPSISVIIPAYNAELFLGQAIESVINQTHTNWEVIIVDDGSTDSTFSIASEFVHRDSRIRLIRQNNAGASSARNYGFAESSPSSEYVLFLDADDVLAPNA